MIEQLPETLFTFQRLGNGTYRAAVVGYRSRPAHVRLQPPPSGVAQEPRCARGMVLTDIDIK